MNFIQQMSIGVEHFCFALKAPCDQNPTMNGHVSLSLNLSATFFRAAMTDQIKETVDYEELCLDIARRFQHLNCATLHAFNKQLESALSRFYPVIKDAYFSMTLNCHASFTCEASFAISPPLKVDYE
jgi:hypothetical protein